MLKPSKIMVPKETYIRYCKKYRLPIKNDDGSNKTIKQLHNAIYQYEMKFVLPVAGKSGLFVSK